MFFYTHTALPSQLTVALYFINTFMYYPSIIPLKPHTHFTPILQVRTLRPMEVNKLTLTTWCIQCSLTLNNTSTDFYATFQLNFYHSTNTVPLWNIKYHYHWDFSFISVASCFMANSSLHHWTSSLIWPQYTPFTPARWVSQQRTHTCYGCPQL